jgi:hypothetical protein
MNRYSLLSSTTRRVRQRDPVNGVIWHLPDVIQAVSAIVFVLASVARFQPHGKIPVKGKTNF